MENYFLKTLVHLRNHQEMILYNGLPTFSAKEEDEVSSFLRQLYYQESLEYPYTSPLYDEEAGLWAAKYLYLAAQLLLYRKKAISDLNFPIYTKEKKAGGILSADISLRYIPDIIIKLRLIDVEDDLIPVLENLLAEWHYSGIKYPMDISQLDFKPIMENDCLRQLYVDRVLAEKNKTLSELPILNPYIKASIGIFGSYFYP